MYRLCRGIAVDLRAGRTAERIPVQHTTGGGGLPHGRPQREIRYGAGGVGVFFVLFERNPAGMAYSSGAVSAGRRGVVDFLPAVALAGGTCRLYCRLYHRCGGVYRLTVLVSALRAGHHARCAYDDGTACCGIRYDVCADKNAAIQPAGRLLPAVCSAVRGDVLHTGD